MKIYLKKFLIILITITSIFNVIFPSLCLADEEESFNAGEIEYAIENGKLTYGGSTFHKFIPDKTGWYKYSISSLSMKYLEKIFYFSANGDIVYPTLHYSNSGTLNYSDKIYLIKENVYWLPYAEGAKYGAELSLANDKGIIEGLEAMCAKFVYSLANGLHILTSYALGQSVTMDDVIFNHYCETDISFFEQPESGGSSLIWGQNGTFGLRNVVSTWYSIFLKIAIVGYLSILVYMGIRVILSSTSEKKADFKQFFTNWIIGVLILFLLPYGMKYIIKLNNAMVSTIEANKGFSDEVKTSNIELQYSKGLEDVALDYEIDWSSGNDYMSTIAQQALSTERLGLAIAFMIMTWQLITLIMHYFKRVFMLAFLIVIFPLVALSYAIDKIADGKSQALNTWLKEFILNVCIQSFHAIIYVFMCSTVYMASSNNDQYDFILVIVGASFLFKGEEIIKSIFGQTSGAGTMSNLKETAASSYAKVAIGAATVKNTFDYTVGEKSVAKKVWRGVNGIRGANARMKMFRNEAKADQEYDTGKRLEHAPEQPPKEEKKNYRERMDLFNAAATLNNPEAHSYEEKAKALEKLRKQAKKNKNDDVFKDTKFSADDLLKYDMLDKDAQTMVNRGFSAIDIERDIEFKISIIYPKLSEEARKDKVNTYMASLFLNGSLNKLNKNEVKNNIDEAIKDIEKVEKSIVLSDVRHGNKYKNVVLDPFVRYADLIYIDSAKMLPEQQKAIRQYAHNLGILMNRNSDMFTAEELYDATEYVREHVSDTAETINMFEDNFTEDGKEIDLDMFKHILSKKVIDSGKDFKDSDGNDVCRAAVDSYEDEAHIRDGYFNDEICIHEVIKYKDDIINRTDKGNSIINNLYDAQNTAMNEQLEKVARDYLVKNDVDLIEGSYDTKTKLLNGYDEKAYAIETVEELERMFADISAVNKAKASDDKVPTALTNWLLKKYMRGDSSSRKEKEDYDDHSVSYIDYKESVWKRRYKNKLKHFYERELKDDDNDKK